MCCATDYIGSVMDPLCDVHFNSPEGDSRSLGGDFKRRLGGGSQFWQEFKDRRLLAMLL